MSLNTQLNLGVGGDTMVTIDLANFATFGYTSGATTPPAGSLIKLPAVVLYASQVIGTVPTPVLAANPLPVGINGAIPAGTNVIGHLIVDSGSITLTGTSTITTNAEAALAAGTAPSKAVALLGQYNTTAPAPTNGQTVALQVNSAGSLLVSGESLKNTYSATATFTAATSATDIAILPGSATKTIKVLRVKVQLSSTNAQAQNIVTVLQKRSTANSGGTPVSMTVVPHGSNNVAATAVPLNYTANPTTGNSIGNVDSAVISTQGVPSSGAAENNNEWVVDYTSPGMQPIELRGVAQGLAVNLGGVTVTATNTVKVTYTYTEE
jgi:hypothetical protein